MAQNDTKKKQKSSNNESSTDEIALPLDGGFGWVIVAASFLTHIISKHYKIIVHEFFSASRNNEISSSHE